MGSARAFGEEWLSLPRKDLPLTADLCDRQAARFKQGLVEQIDSVS